MESGSIVTAIASTDDPGVLHAFQDLAEAADGYATYTNTYTMADMYGEDFSALHGLIQAADAFMTHRNSFYNMPEIKAFREVSNAGMACMKYKYDFEPMDIRYHKLLPHALVIVYGHMGYPAINDVVFLEMAATYEVYRLQQQCRHCYGVSVCRASCSSGFGWYSHGYYHLDLTTIDITACRDVPKAVTYMHRSTYNLDPIEVLAFRDVAEAADGYCTFTNDFDDWSDELVAAFRTFSEAVSQWLVYENGYEPLELTVFKDVAAAGLGHMDYEPPPYFPHFPVLAAELRVSIIHEYLLLERDAGHLSKHQHYDDWGNECCVWHYPEVLIACDNQKPGVFPSAATGRCPQGWLPLLAFTSKQMLGEVVVHMLQQTKRIDLKYHYDNWTFKIATWFRKFLEAISGNDGVQAVKHLNFPHMHWFNHQRIPPALKNDSVELMVACRNLREVEMTFHAQKVTAIDPVTYQRSPLPLHYLLDYFRLRPMLECRNLKQIYFDGIYASPSRGGSPTDLDALVDLAKWLMKGFLIQQERQVQVEVGRRWGAWRGRLPGVIIELSNEEMDDVNKQIALKKGVN